MMTDKQTSAIPVDAPTDSHTDTDAFNDALSAQQTLLKAILSENTASGFDEHGLEPYRRGLQGNASRALAVSFPTVYQLVGPQGFELLTKAYLQFDPPTTGDWGLWGERLADLLPTLSALEDYPYLADCAALDWACHHAERAADRRLETETLERLAHAPDRIMLGLGMGFSVIASPYPIVDIYHAHQQQSAPDRDHFMTLAREKLTRGEGQNVLVWRQQWKANVRAISDTDTRWCQCLLQAPHLEACLDHMANTTFTFDTWLPEAIQQGWVLSVHPADHAN